jgi:hypothetical protein
LPSQAAQVAAGWRYVAQGRWSEPGLLPLSTTANVNTNGNANANANANAGR